jgi:hypothetical protein
VVFPALILVGALFSSALQAPPPARRAPDITLPPMSWTCPMHPDVLKARDEVDKDPTCPICRMKLVPVRLEAVWACQNNSSIVATKPGTCPIDGRSLVPMTMALSWTCQGHPEIDELTPGPCPDGTAMLARHTPRPHGNHNPQHGGQFFMAADNWHHLEGTYPRAGIFRVFLYDDYTRPLPLDQAKHVTGTVTTADRAPVPLLLKANGRYLEARVDAHVLPIRVAASITFNAGGPAYRFDFAFPATTKDPLPPVAVRATTPPSPADAARAAGVDPSLIPTPIPDTIDAMVAALKTRDGQIRDLIRRGALTDVYAPAFQAKDLALALDEHIAQIPVDRRSAIEPAIRELVRTAWLLDAFGDTGNRQQLTDAYALFSSALNRIESAIPVR